MPLHRQNIGDRQSSPTIRSLAQDFALFAAVIVMLPFLAIARIVSRR